MFELLETFRIPIMVPNKIIIPIVKPFKVAS